MIDSIIKVLDKYNKPYKFDGELLIISYRDWKFYIKDESIKCTYQTETKVDSEYNHIAIYKTCIYFYNTDEFLFIIDVDYTKGKQQC